MMTSCVLFSRNPRLASLISHVSTDCSNPPTVDSVIALDGAIFDVKAKESSQMVRLLYFKQLLRFITNIVIGIILYGK